MVLHLLLQFSWLSVATVASMVLPGCPEKCGNITVPYPFGIRQGCYKNKAFQMVCNDTIEPPRLFTSTDSNLEVLNISLEGEVRIRGWMSWDCYSSPGVRFDQFNGLMDLKNSSPYTFSSTRNTFAVIGCNTGANLTESSGSGCFSSCNEYSVTNASCTGNGCCQTNVPKDLKRFDVRFTSIDNSWATTPCSFAFFVASDAQEQTVSDILDGNRYAVPIVLDWRIGNETCYDAERNLTSYGCTANSSCSQPLANSSGYICLCPSGFSGNPYIDNGCSKDECSDPNTNPCQVICKKTSNGSACSCPPGAYGDGRKDGDGCKCLQGYHGSTNVTHGCQDIDECADTASSKCQYLCINTQGSYQCSCPDGYHGDGRTDGSTNVTHGCQDIDECADTASNKCQHLCINTQGSYQCSCPDGYHGDGRTDGKGCIVDSDNESPVIKIAVGIGLGLLFLLVGSYWLYWNFKKRHIERRKKFYRKNGGLLLQQKISSHEGVAEMTKIFTVKELKIATNNYDAGRILGQGGHGTVYKGILPGNRTVAIKKSKMLDPIQVKQFINEVAILSQVNHRNIVKLLGCCLETQVPSLVYEYVSNGTLFQHIHSEGSGSSISWENRLRIATEAAGALAYLHSSISIPIIHRDVKSTNILLDDDYTAKVSDFGASRSIPFDKPHITTAVQGTYGYLDPEYFFTSKLTDKSDVYSFGVLLVELLTGEKPISLTRPEEDRNLVSYFISSMNENRLLQVIDTQVVNEVNEEQLLAVADLAKRCLRQMGDERPTMKEVAAELEGLRRTVVQTSTVENQLETECLLNGVSQNYPGDAARQHSLEKQFIVSLDVPR